MSEDDTLLMAYADGELDPKAAREVEELLERDPEARRAVEIYRETTSLLRAACGEHAYAGESERIAPAAPRPAHRAWTRYGRTLMTAVAACVVGFLGGSQWLRSSQAANSSFASEVAEYHAVYSEESKHLVEVPAERAEEIVSWLGRRLDRPIKIPDLSAEGLRFAGARMLVFDGRPVAQFMYTREEGRPIGFCITKLDGGPTPIEVDRHDSERTAVWRDAEYAYIVVGETDKESIRTIAVDAARQTQS